MFFHNIQRSWFDESKAERTKEKDLAGAGIEPTTTQSWSNRAYHCAKITKAHELHKVLKQQNWVLSWL